MPEPRETHTAIDARRNARGGGEREALADLLTTHWLKTREGVPVNGAQTVVGVCQCGIESAPQFFDWRVWHWHNLHLADAILAAGWEHPDDEVLVEGSWFARPDLPLILGNFMRRCDEYGREAKALAATVARVRTLADEWEAEADEDEDWLNGPRVAVSEAQEYPATIRTTRGHVSDLRAALAPSDPATDTGGEGDG